MSLVASQASSGWDIELCKVEDAGEVEMVDNYQSKEVSLDSIFVLL